MKFVLLLLCVVAAVAVNNFKYVYKTKYIEVPLDHFSYATNATFQLRYLINDSYHSQRGPIFFYTGNEGDINMFAQNTGFMFDIAPKFNALLVFAEHRYYGTSLPFGNQSYDSPKYLGYLSSEQALADFIYLINNLQKTYGVTPDPIIRDLRELPVVAFGGSYGGMLAAWLRMKYPNSVVGAIASSAPIWLFKNLTPCENFYRVTSGVFEGLGSAKCTEVIKKSWKILRSLASNNNSLANLSQEWKLCALLKTPDDIDNLIGWLSNIYINLAMLNYPYPTDFLTSLPAHPVREFCSKIKTSNQNDTGLLKELGVALEVYTNYTGNTKCNSLNSTSTHDLGETGWNFQTCTEMIMPMCSTNLDMFEDQPWDFKKYSDECWKTFSVRPRDEDVPILEYGGKNLGSFSNIVFSNGLFDPWSSGGVLSNMSESVLAVIIPDGAHHYDLRANNPQDSQAVMEARNFHILEIRKWLKEYFYDHLGDHLISNIFRVQDNYPIN